MYSDPVNLAKFLNSIFLDLGVVQVENQFIKILHHEFSIQIREDMAAYIVRIRVKGVDYSEYKNSPNSFTGFPKGVVGSYYTVVGIGGTFDYKVHNMYMDFMLSTHFIENSTNTNDLVDHIIKHVRNKFKDVQTSKAFQVLYGN